MSHNRRASQDMGPYVGNFAWECQLTQQNGGVA